MRRLIVMIGLSLLLTRPLAAQISSYCGQLAEVDCALLRDAQQSLFEMQAATLNRAVFDMGEGTEMLVTAAGQMATFPLVAGQRLLALGDLQLEGTLAVDLGQLVDRLPPEVRLDSVHLRLIDGVAYFDMDSLEPANSTLQGWVSLDLTSNMPQWFETDPPEPSLSAAVVTGVDVDQLQATYSPAVLNSFIHVTRRGDVFETQVDFAAMYAHPVFQTTLREQILAYWDRYDRGLSLNDESMAELAQQMAELYPEPLTLLRLTVDPATRQARSLYTLRIESLLVMLDAGLVGHDMREWLPGSVELDVDFDETGFSAAVNRPSEFQPLTTDLLQEWPALQFWFGPQPVAS